MFDSGSRLLSAYKGLKLIMTGERYIKMKSLLSAYKGLKLPPEGLDDPRIIFVY